MTTRTHIRRLVQLAACYAAVANRKVGCAGPSTRLAYRRYAAYVALANR